MIKDMDGYEVKAGDVVLMATTQKKVVRAIVYRAEEFYEDNGILYVTTEGNRKSSILSNSCYRLFR